MNNSFHLLFFFCCKNNMRGRFVCGIKSARWRGIDQQWRFLQVHLMKTDCTALARDEARRNPNEGHVLEDSPEGQCQLCVKVKQSINPQSHIQKFVLQDDMGFAVLWYWKHYARLQNLIFLFSLSLFIILGLCLVFLKYCCPVSVELQHGHNLYVSIISIIRSFHDHPPCQNVSLNITILTQET